MLFFVLFFSWLLFFSFFFTNWTQFIFLKLNSNSSSVSLSKELSSELFTANFFFLYFSSKSFYFFDLVLLLVLFLFFFCFIILVVFFLFHDFITCFRLFDFSSIDFSRENATFLTPWSWEDLFVTSSSFSSSSSSRLIKLDELHVLI